MPPSKIREFRVELSHPPTYHFFDSLTTNVFLCQDSGAFQPEYEYMDPKESHAMVAVFRFHLRFSPPLTLAALGTTLSLPLRKSE